MCVGFKFKWPRAFVLCMVQTWVESGWDYFQIGFECWRWCRAGGFRICLVGGRIKKIKKKGEKSREIIQNLVGGRRGKKIGGT